MKHTTKYEISIIHDFERVNTIDLDLHKKTYTVGRDESNDVFIPESSRGMSREHAIIFTSNGDWYLRDRSSFETTSVQNDFDDKEKKLKYDEVVKLVIGDRIKFTSSKWSVTFDAKDQSFNPKNRDLDKETRVSKVIEIDKNTRIVSIRGKQNRLSPTEFKVLYLLYQNSEKICKNFKIKGTNYLFRDPKVVKNIYKIRKKLKNPILPDDVSKIVERIPYEGYRLNNEEQK